MHNYYVSKQYICFYNSIIDRNDNHIKDDLMGYYVNYDFNVNININLNNIYDRHSIYCIELSCFNGFNGFNMTCIKINKMNNKLNHKSVNNNCSIKIKNIILNDTNLIDNIFCNSDIHMFIWLLILSNTMFE